MTNNQSNYQSVVQLSEDCVKRLQGYVKGQTEPIKQTENTMQEVKKPIDAEEEECKRNTRGVPDCGESDCAKMYRLRCIDERHSIENGLTIEDFERLYERVYSQTNITYTMPCSGDQLIRCLQKNPKCAIKCMDYANMFVDCVDRERVKKMKSIVEKEMQKEREKNEEELKKLLGRKC